MSKKKTTPPPAASGLAGMFGSSSPTATAVPSPPPVIPPYVPPPAAPSMPLPDSQIMLLGKPWDPFNQAQHEAKMNAWLMQANINSNAAKVAIYEHSYKDWEENAQRFIDLHMAVPPPPIIPTLAVVGPMPDGYWFGKTA